MKDLKRAFDLARALTRRFFNWISQGNTRVKVIFLLLSAVLWFLIKLSKPGYESVVKLPITVKNIPENQVLVSVSPRQLSLRLRANGFNLLKYSFLRYQDIALDLRHRELDSSGMYHWSSQALTRELTAQLSERVRVLAVNPDSVTVKLNRLVTRAIPVVPRVALEAQGGRVLYAPPQTEPAQIQVTGPLDKLRTLDTLYTETWRIQSPEEDSLRRELPLKLPAVEGLQFAQTAVTTTVKVARLTEKTVTVPVEIRSSPPHTQIELFPPQVEITYQVALRDYQKVNAGKFELFVDLEKQPLGPERRFLDLQVGTVPPQVREYRLGRSRVEFIARAL